jgi:hypothetical protein
MGSSNIRSLAACVGCVLAIGSGQVAQAQWGPDLSGLNDAVVAGEVVLTLTNACLAVAEATYIGTGERSGGLAGASLIFGVIGMLAGVPAIGHDSPGSLNAAGIATVVTSSINIVLAVVQLFQPFKKERQDIALAPVTLVDASGQLTAGAGLTGRF